MLLSDRDLRAELDAGRVGLDPYDPAMIQPSSVDVRLDRYFRVFENHRYPHIDPAEEQPDLTELVEVRADEAFILHPGEFFLASTYEVVTLPDDKGKQYMIPVEKIAYVELGESAPRRVGFAGA